MKLGLELGNSASQRTHQLFDFLCRVPWRDVFGAVPVERVNIDEDQPLHTRPHLRFSDLRNKFWMGTGVFHTSMTKNFQPFVVLVVHEEQRHTVVH